MAEFFSAIMMESSEVTWREKGNAPLSDAGPEDGRLNIEFEGDLEGVPWLAQCSDEGKIVVDVDTLIASKPQLFDRPWLRGRGKQDADLAVMGNHFIIDLRLPAARESK